MNGSLVVVSWDGKSQPHRFVGFDQEPAFDLLTFDYSGTGTKATADRSISRVLSKKTECKGEIFKEVAVFLEGNDAKYDYVGLMDDDVMIRMSDINHMIHIARSCDLDSFAPSLSHDSIHTHANTLRLENRLLHAVPWVEIMSPFYKTSLFLAAAPHYSLSKSGWGIDCFLMPLFQKIMKMEQVAVIDAIMATHMRPISSNTRRFSGGLTAFQEMELMGRFCVRYLKENHPELIDCDWYRNTFAGVHRQAL
jgi:hypothetical protein